jgi:hypothetical protein
MGLRLLRLNCDGGNAREWHAKHYFLRATRNVWSHFGAGAASVFIRWEPIFGGTGESSSVAGAIQSMSVAARALLHSCPSLGQRGSGSSDRIFAGKLVDFFTASAWEFKSSSGRCRVADIEGGAAFLPGLRADEVNPSHRHSAENYKATTNPNRLVHPKSVVALGCRIYLHVDYEEHIVCMKRL